ncbi:hypothetical protein GCM10010278_79280 [Streptomyces melanogenes]|nr:hypothetical protein GCM10010278_79280 [Streptomyces melanogenes]
MPARADVIEENPGAAVGGRGHREVVFLPTPASQQETSWSSSGLRIHNPDVDLSDDGPALDGRWAQSDNNLCGLLPDSRDASHVAERFVRAGWRSRSSSWEGYEIETSWCRIEADPTDNSATLLNGVIDPDRLDDLAALLTQFGLRFHLELYDDERDLIREIKG